MTIDYTQINYHPDIEEKAFPNSLEEVKLISIDSCPMNNVHSKVFDNDDDMIKDYINRQYDYYKQMGTYYNWVITLNGNIYHMTPENKASHSCAFLYYSDRMSRELPTICPQYKIDLSDVSTTPDKVIETICLEINAGEVAKPSFKQEQALKNLLAYLLQLHSLSASKIITRSMITKVEYLKKDMGHVWYKDHISDLVNVAAYAVAISKENEVGINPTSSLMID